MNDVLVLGGPLHGSGIDTGCDPLPHFTYPIREPPELTIPTAREVSRHEYKKCDYMLIRLFDGLPIYIPRAMDISNISERPERSNDDRHRRIPAIERLAMIAVEYNKERGYRNNDNNTIRDRAGAGRLAINGQVQELR